MPTDILIVDDEADIRELVAGLCLEELNELFAALDIGVELGDLGMFRLEVSAQLLPLAS